MSSRRPGGRSGPCRLERSTPPNPRLQRTRLRGPLSRQPLGIRMRFRVGLATAVIGGLFVSSPVTACGLCVLAAVDFAAPPAFLWFWLPISWFVLTSILASLAGYRLAHVPGIVVGLAIAFAALFVGGAFLGPISTIPLAVFPVYLFVKSWVHGDEWPSQRLRWGVAVVGSLHVLAIAIGVGVGVRTLQTRTDGAYICRWSGTAPGHARFKELARHGNAALADYRFILGHSDAPYLAAETAEVLANVGHWHQDVPILEATLARFAGDQDASTRIRAAISKLKHRGSGA